MTEAPPTTWQPSFSPWRHGGWYVDNVRYASGAVGCVSRNYADRKWRIVCDGRPNAHELHTYPNRDAAARAEYALATASLDALHDALRVLDDLTSDDFALGRDRPVRRVLVHYLAAHGFPLDDVELREYGVPSPAVCSCAHHDDGSITTMLCPLHADADPCWTMAMVTGRRRTGSIVRGVCSACGHRQPREMAR